MRLLFLSCKDTNYNSIGSIAARKNITLSVLFDDKEVEMQQRAM